ncbi:M20 metallopeptidase family protein [Cytobacillus purgationiresistens]|uniref:Amidohydrolase n=1 Tax=Cytobacillus purgationiresistens TaxID=863449 RepID=A0ABU0ABJ3_9BACI|nr:amidohydrolase [Cytobacillus purgationiresistens]MDQ0268249.1 amidohydrolase [Cytobacillus purgationiresistens]
MINIKLIDSELKDWAVKQRRYFHMYPELSGQEYQTAAYVRDRLKEFGLTPDLKFSTPNIVARFYGTEGKRTIALRADMDALPLQEEGNKAYTSTVSGVMHACGHDGHTAILLSVAKWITSHAEAIKNNIVFIFQSSEEESPSGAKKLVEEGVLDGVDAIYGVHLISDVPLGKIGFAEGFSMASSDDFDIIIEGVGGHGGNPQDAIDPIYIATHLIQAFQSVVSRNLHPLQAGVISIGGMQAGNSYNVIPHQVKIQGTIRAMTFETAQMMYVKTEQLTKSISASFGAKGHYDYIPGTPPLYNHPEACETAKKVIIDTFGEDAFLSLDPSMGAEDYSFYVKEKTGAFINVGMKSEKSSYPHHHPKFDIDEEAIPTAIELMIQFAIQG